MTDDPGLPRGLVLDYREAPVTPQDAAMLAYVVKLTRAPHTVSQADVELLRTHGFGDAAILDICQVASYYNYVNRLADGLGVELESTWTADQMIITRDEFEHRRDRR